jgi:hypothetical protein
MHRSRLSEGGEYQRPLIKADFQVLSLRLNCKVIKSALESLAASSPRVLIY